MDPRGLEGKKEVQTQNNAEIKSNKQRFNVSDFYSKDDVEEIKKNFKEDGRYEKSRTESRIEKHYGRPDSEAKLTVQDLFPNKKTRTPIIRYTDESGTPHFYAVLDKLGKGAFGKVKLAADLENPDHIVVIKTQETFELGQAFGRFEPRKIQKEEELIAKVSIPKIHNQLWELIALLKDQSQKKKQLELLYQIYNNISPYLNEYLEVQDDDALDSLSSVFPYKKNAPLLDKENFNNEINLDTIKECLNSMVTFCRLPKRNEKIDSKEESQTFTQHGKFLEFSKEVKERAELELEALKKLGRGTGTVTARRVERGRQVKDFQYTLIMDFVPGKTLHETIIEGEPKNYPLTERLNIAKGIIEDWTKLRNAGFYHGDLKPENIKYDEETKQVKLIDFGSVSKIGEDGVALTLTQGSPFYAPKDRPYGFGKATEATEVYALGKFFLEMMPELKNNEFLNKMCSEKQEERPSMKEVLSQINELTHFYVRENKLKNFIKGSLNQINELGLRGGKQKLLNQFIESLKTKTADEVIVDLEKFFKSQCEKYSKPGFFSKQKDAIHLLNTERNGHFLTRGIGTMLKTIYQTQPIKGNDLEKKLSRLKSNVEVQQQKPQSKISSFVFRKPFQG